MSNSIQSQLVEFVASSLATADHAFVDDFIKNGPIGGEDANCRYLLAVALRQLNPTGFARLTNASLPVAERLMSWLDAGTRS